MQFATVIVAAFAGFAAATPLIAARGSLCSSAIDVPQCCQTTVVEGVADLSCEKPSWGPKTFKELEAVCAKTGYTAKCCTLPVDGDGLLCGDN